MGNNQSSQPSITQLFQNSILNVQRSVQASLPPPPPPPKLSENGLKVQDSFECGWCQITVDSTITSSSLVLSRDILGKMDAPDTGTAADDWVWDAVVHFVDGKPVQDINDNGGGAMDWDPLTGVARGRRGYGRGNWYKRADPSTFGKDGVNAEGQRWMNNYDDLRNNFNADYAAWKKIQDDHDKEMKAAGKMVYIWNPSDDALVQMNKDKYGALTRLFLKPTLPFKVSFNNGSGSTEVVVNVMSVFHPCPIRIETIQYDAVIQIGDFRGLSGTDCNDIEDTSPEGLRELARRKAAFDRQIAPKAKAKGDFETKFNQQKVDDFNAGRGWRSASANLEPEYMRLQKEIDDLTAKRDALKPRTKKNCTARDGTADKVVFFIPLKINDNPKPPFQLAQTKFINTFANKIPSILGAQPDKKLGYPDVPAATNNDWKLSDILDANDCYYTWKVKLDDQTTTNVVFMKNPVCVLSSDMASILRLPITPPSDVFHSAPADVRFHSCPPKNADGTTASCPAPAGSLPNIPITQPPVKVPAGAGIPNGKGVTSSPSFDPNLIWQVILGVIGTIAIVIGVWMGIKLAAGPGGDMFRKLGDALGKQLAGAYKSVKDAKMPALSSPKSPPADTRTPEQLADISPTTIPEPSGDFATSNPLFKDKKDFLTRQRGMTQRNKQVRTSTQRNPIKTADKIAAAPAPPASTAAVIEPDADELLRRRRAERNRLAQPAGTGLFDLGNTPKPADEIGQRKPKGPGKKAIKGPEESNTQRIAALARAHKKTPKRRVIDAEEPDEPEGSKTSTIFDSPAIRANYGISEKKNTEPQYLATAKTVPRKGGRKRRHRLKTGRQV